MENISNNSELTAKKAIVTLIKAIRLALSKEIYSPEESDIIIKSMKMFEPNLKNEGDYGWDKVPVDVQMNYMNQCDAFVQSDEKFNNFKRDTHYQKILEGGDHIVGTHAIDWLKNTGGYQYLLDNLKVIKENDIYGNPILSSYEDIKNISSGTLKYVACSLEIIRLLNQTKPKKILEVGGGYGGLCKTISNLIDFDEYIIADLPPVIDLAKKYLSKFDKLNGKLKFISSEDDMVVEGIDLFIADASLAELGKKAQEKYYNNFIKNSKFGFISWNTNHIAGADVEFADLLEKIRLQTSSKRFSSTQPKSKVNVHDYMGANLLTYWPA